MQRNEKSIIWNSGELIYSSGAESNEAYLIVEGFVNLETADGFRLSRLGAGEIFGETSLLLGTKRTVTAKACKQKVVANVIPKEYFKKTFISMSYMIGMANTNPAIGPARPTSNICRRSA